MSVRASLCLACEDMAAAERLAQALRDHNVQVEVEVAVASEVAVEVGESSSARGRRSSVGESPAFLFLISDDSLRSPACRRDLEHAVALGRRVIPVVLREVARDRLPVALADRNWIVLADAGGMDALLEALQVDPRLRDEHARIAARTGEWVRSGHHRSALLRGGELRSAEAWLTHQETGAAAPTTDEARYVAAGRHAAVVRRRAQLGVVLSALLATVVLAVLALVQRHDAAAIARAAVSRGLAAQAVSVGDQDPALAGALSVEAQRADATPEAADAVRVALGRLGPAIGSLTRHGGPVYGVAFGGQSRLLVSASADATVRIWDVATRSQVGTPLRGHVKDVQALALSTDGSLIASGGVDGTVRLWSVARHSQIGAPLRGHRKTVASVAFSRDGTKLVSAGDDGTVRLWDVANRHEIGSPLRGHKGSIHAVAFSPSGDLVASAGVDGTLRVWDVGRQRQSGSPLRGHAGIAQAVAFSPDGRTLASGGLDETVRLWDVVTHRQSGAPLRALRAPLSGLQPPLYVGAVAFSPDGRTLASADIRAVRRWDVATHEPVGPPLTTGGSNALAFSADGRTLASPGFNGSVTLLHGEWAAAPLLLLPHQPLNTIAADSVDSAFNRDMTTRVSAGDDGRLRLWNVADNAPLGPPFGTGRQALEGVAMTSDGALLASAGDDGTVRLWSVAKRRQLGASLHSGPGIVWGVAFSPDGRTLASGGADSVVRLWDVASRRRLGPPLRGHTSGVRSVAFSPDGRTLVSAGGGLDKSLRLWGVATRKPIGRPLRGHSNTIEDVAFSPDGRMLASGADDGAVRLWDVAMRRSLGGPLAGHAGRVMRVAFSPDGRTLASADDHSTLRLWDAETRTAIGQPLTGVVFGGGFVGLGFRPNGRKLLSVGRADDEALMDSILWRGDDRARRARVCAVARRDLSRAEWREHLPDTPYRTTCSGA